MNPESAVHEVKMETFETIVESNGIVILDFWAAWCQPCKVFAPAFKMMAELHPELFFGSVNTEIEKELSEAFQIRSIPTLMAFKNGDLVYEQPGILPVEAFNSLVEKLKQN